LSINFQPTCKITQGLILDAHAVAKEINDDECGALSHAIGHAGATVHVETHALGLPIYELTALVLKYGKDGYQKPVRDKIDYYCQRLLYQFRDSHFFKWVFRFLLRWG